MKLWLLRPADYNGGSDLDPWKPWYDKPFGYVVRAETELAARQLTETEMGPCHDEMHGAWLNPELSSCVELTNDGPEGVVMVDFWAA